jgi:S-adenosylmethionine hydrolase
VRLEVPVARRDAAGITGQVIGLDGPFGNVITNIPGPELSALGYALGETVKARIGGEEVAVPFVKTFSDVESGRALLYVDSRGRLALAINQGNFAEAHHVAPPVAIHIAAPRR